MEVIVLKFLALRTVPWFDSSDRSHIDKIMTLLYSESQVRCWMNDLNILKNIIQTNDGQLYSDITNQYRVIHTCLSVCSSLFPRELFTLFNNLTPGHPLGILALLLYWFYQSFVCLPFSPLFKPLEITPLLSFFGTPLPHSSNISSLRLS